MRTIKIDTRRVLLLFSPEQQERLRYIATKFHHSNSEMVIVLFEEYLKKKKCNMMLH